MATSNRKTKSNDFGIVVALLLAIAYALRGLFEVFAWVIRAIERARIRRNPAYKQEALLALRKVDVRSMSPLDFEAHCARILSAQGWAAAPTKATGDFGVDVVAKWGGQTVVVQSKKWASKVGIGAVQEVVAGMPMYGAQSAVVVSMVGFFPSAKKLARVHKVVLLTYPELFEFNRHFPKVCVGENPDKTVDNHARQTNATDQRGRSRQGLHVDRDV